MAITGADFTSAFVDAYGRIRNELQKDWEDYWSSSTRWSDMMLWGLERSGRSVIGETAAALRLRQWKIGEPFTIDTVLVPADTETKLAANYPLPILVAIEHENDHRSFVVEQTKLACLRAPLKVGITYLLKEGRADEKKTQDDIRDEAQRIHQHLSKHDVGEDPRSEYVYLLGVETLRDLVWHELRFVAGQEPAATSWKCLGTS